MGLINKIVGPVDNTNYSVDINVCGRNLLILGGNGSGKTSFLRGVFNKVKLQVFGGGLDRYTQIKREIKNYESALASSSLANDQKGLYLQNLSRLKDELDVLSRGVTIEYNEISKFKPLIETGCGIFRFFEAGRKAEIRNVTSAMASKPSIEQVDLGANLGHGLEQHLVNLKVRAALGSQYSGDDSRLIEIDSWFSSFTESLKYLFEDDSTDLIFDPDRLKFAISQSGKLPFSFQTLSSGYLAIFDIYADLLMRTEYLGVTSKELRGVIFIDEIDAHLHVSIQRKIFPFLTNSFPGLQFIVTTHSPFVLTSVDDALIYDLTNNRESEDVSMYSFESVVEGLLGVPPVSKQLEDTMKHLAKVTREESFDLEVARSILGKVAPYLDTLDDESAMFYQVALNKVLQKKSGGA